MITRYYKSGIEVSETDNPTQIEHTHRIYKVRQVETGEVYPTAVDPYPSRYTYEVSDIPQDTSAIAPEPDPNTLDGAIALKLAECEEWNASSAVCEFYLNGEPFPVWLGKSERSEMINSLNAYIVAGQEVAKFGYAGVVLTLPCVAGLGMIQELQIYANEAEAVKVGHLVAISALATIEEVEAYDYKNGYPPKKEYFL